MQIKSRRKSVSMGSDPFAILAEQMASANGDSPGVMRLSKQCRYHRESVPDFREGA